jgi:RimJ/RimL family protein N-acetyltransferase
MAEQSAGTGARTASRPGIRRAPVKLQPVEGPELIHLVAGWLAQKENYQWLDFGDGRRALAPAWLKILTQRKDTVLRVYTTDEHAEPIGLVGLDDVNRTCRTARIWAVAGDKSFAARGYATRAVSAMLTFGFQELGLHAINTWIVEGNPSVRVVERLNFRFLGRQRQCHYIDGRPYDRLWFDLLASEHRTSE